MRAQNHAFENTTKDVTEKDSPDHYLLPHTLPDQIRAHVHLAS
jgi:hypothetical protein